MPGFGIGMAGPSPSLAGARAVFARGVFGKDAAAAAVFDKAAQVAVVTDTEE